MSENWLQDFLTDAIRRELCTRIYCTTCGAREFRTGVVEAYCRSAGQERGNSLERDQVLGIARALAGVQSDGLNEYELEDAVRCLLMDLWTGLPLYDNEVEDILRGSWAGEALRDMQEHSAQREAARRAERERIDPVLAAQRREEKKRLKQEQHRLRMDKQKEHNRIWYEQQRQKKADD